MCLCTLNDNVDPRHARSSWDDIHDITHQCILHTTSKLLVLAKHVSFTPANSCKVINAIVYTFIAVLRRNVKQALSRIKMKTN